MTNAPIYLLYATHDGHTGRLAARLRHRWAALGCACIASNLSAEEAPDGWTENAALVILAPIRFGHHLPPIERFLKDNRGRLDESKLVMISVNVTARKPDKNDTETNPYYRKWLRKHQLRPALGAVFGGRLEYRLYKTWEKWVIRFIMILTKGPTAFDTAIDYTDWARVDALAKEIAALDARKDAA